MESFIGFVYPAGFNFAPVNYAFCAGQVISIADNSALYALLGTAYGGDGRVTMGLPDLRARAPIGSNVMGNPLPPLSPVYWGAKGGNQYITLNQAQLPTHNHAAAFTPDGVSSPVQVEVSTDEGDLATPQSGAYLSRTKATGGQADKPENIYVSSPTPASLVDLGGVTGGGTAGGHVTVGNTGGSASVDVQSPYTGMSYVITMQGIFPSRN